MTLPYRGRRRAYTARGITRIPCARCGRPSTQQWDTCANGHRFMGVCTSCDILLNAMVLRFFRFPKRTTATLLRAYRRRAAGSGGRAREADV